MSSSAALGLALVNHAVVAAPASLAATVTGMALAASSVGAATTATLLSFMSTTKAILGIAVVAMIAALDGLQKPKGTTAAAVASQATASATIRAPEATVLQILQGIEKDPKRDIGSRKSMGALL